MGMGKYLKASILVFFVYIFIYDPPIKGLPEPILLLLPVVYIYLLCYSLIGKLFYLFKNELILVFLISLFTLLRDINWTGGINKDFLFVNVTLLIEVIPFAFFIADICYRNASLISVKTSDDRLIEVILWTSFIASVITFILVMKPSLNHLMNNKILESTDYQENNLIRGFGFSSGLFYAYGLVQGIAAAIILLKLSDGKKYFLAYFVAFMLLVVSILVNARIGMAPVVIMIFYLVFVRKKIKMFLYASGVIAVLIVAFLSSDFYAKYEKTLEWGLGFFSQTFGFVSGSSGRGGTTYDTLFGKMVVLPPGFFDWIIGTGRDIFLTKDITGTVKNSDVGFIRQLYYGGLVYLFLLMGLMVQMLVRSYHLKNKRWFFALFLFTAIAGNIKNNFIHNHAAFRLLILIYMGFIYYSFLSGANKSNIKGVKLE
jgi:uncharacterized membrane protein YhaH (DUF805 family)